MPRFFFRVVHAFTSSGMLESQYQGFAEAAKLGNVGDKYIDFGEFSILCNTINHDGKTSLTIIIVN